RYRNVTGVQTCALPILVAFILLALVYGSLTYAGATVGGHFDGNTERTALLIGMVDLMLGNVGTVFMGVAVTLACLTTSTGLTSKIGRASCRERKARQDD